MRIHVGTQSCPVFLLLKGGHNHGTYGVSGMYGYNVGTYGHIMSVCTDIKSVRIEI